MSDDVFRERFRSELARRGIDERAWAAEVLGIELGRFWALTHAQDGPAILARVVKKARELRDRGARRPRERSVWAVQLETLDDAAWLPLRQPLVIWDSREKVLLGQSGRVDLLDGWDEPEERAPVGLPGLPAWIIETGIPGLPRGSYAPDTGQLTLGSEDRWVSVAAGDSLSVDVGDRRVVIHNQGNGAAYFEEFAPGPSGEVVMRTAPIYLSRVGGRDETLYSLNELGLIDEDLEDELDDLDEGLDQQP